MKTKCITIETAEDGSVFIAEEGSSGCTYNNIKCRKDLLNAFDEYLYGQTDLFDPADEEGRKRFLQIEAEKILEKLHILPHNKAYFYLRDASCMGKEDSSNLQNLGKGIISELARRYNATESSVEASMRRAIKKCYNSGRMNDIFKYSRDHESLGEPPRLREFLAEMVNIMDDVSKENSGESPI